MSVKCSSDEGISAWTECTGLPEVFRK